MSHYPTRATARSFTRGLRTILWFVVYATCTATRIVASWFLDFFIGAQAFARSRYERSLDRSAGLVPYVIPTPEGQDRPRLYGFPPPSIDDPVAHSSRLSQVDPRTQSIPRTFGDPLPPFTDDLMVRARENVKNPRRPRPIRPLPPEDES